MCTYVRHTRLVRNAPLLKNAEDSKDEDEWDWGEIGCMGEDEAM